MADYGFTNVVGKIPALFDKIRTVGIPDKVTVAWLNSSGFKSSNDRSLIRPLKQIGLIDSSGTPTELWKNFRSVEYKRVLADAIKSGYKELFEMYPDANDRSKNELQDFFRGQTSASADVVARMTSTFQALVACADFPAGSSSKPQGFVNGLPTAAVSNSGAQDTKTLPAPILSPAVHVDIQIHISPDSSPEQINQIFESIAKNLYERKQ